MWKLASKVSISVDTVKKFIVINVYIQKEKVFGFFQPYVRKVSMNQFSWGEMSTPNFPHITQVSWKWPNSYFAHSTLYTIYVQKSLLTTEINFGWIWPLGGVASGSVCACSLRSKLVRLYPWFRSEKFGPNLHRLYTQLSSFFLSGLLACGCLGFNVPHHLLRWEWLVKGRGRLIITTQCLKSPEPPSPMKPRKL